MLTCRRETAYSTPQRGVEVSCVVPDSIIMKVACLLACLLRSTSSRNSDEKKDSEGGKAVKTYLSTQLTGRRERVDGNCTTETVPGLDLVVGSAEPDVEFSSQRGLVPRADVLLVRGPGVGRVAVPVVPDAQVALEGAVGLGGGEGGIVGIAAEGPEEEIKRAGRRGWGRGGGGGALWTGVCGFAILIAVAWKNRSTVRAGWETSLGIGFRPRLFG